MFVWYSFFCKFLDFLDFRKFLVLVGFWDFFNFREILQVVFCSVLPAGCENTSGHDYWGGTSPPPSWARGGNTYDWSAAAPTLFVFILTATCCMLHRDLTSGLAPSQHICMPPHLTPTSSPPTPLHPIAISVLAINCLSGTYRWASPQCLLRRERPSTSPHALAKYTKEPWLYSPPPLTKERLSVGRA